MTVLREGLHHHAWANEQLLDLCETVSEEQLTQQVPAIYGSVLDTFRHLIESDNWYLWCISQGEFGIEDLRGEEMSLAQLRPVAKATAAGWNRIVQRELDPDADLVTISRDGGRRHATVGIRLAQVLHHGSDHRSQVCTAITTLGYQPPEFDVWEFGEQVGLASEEPPPAV